MEMNSLHAVGADRGRGRVSENSDQSVLLNTTKDSVDHFICSVIKGWCCPAEPLRLSKRGWSAKQKMAPAATCAVRSLPLQLTMVEPEGQGAAATTAGSAKIFIYSKRQQPQERVKELR